MNALFALAVFKIVFKRKLLIIFKRTFCIISTDSSYHYARRVDAAQTENYLELAASLLHKLYGVQVLLPEVFVGKEAIVENRGIILDPQFIRD